MSGPSRASSLVQLDLALVFVLAVAGALASLTPVPLIVRLPLVLGLVLFLPGYALLSAMVVSAGLSVLERVAISIAASIALTIVSGLVVAALGFALDRYGWAVVLTLITVGAVAVAWIRRVQRGVGGPRFSVPGLPMRQAVIGIIAVLIFTDAVLASRLVASDQFGSPPVQLWLVEGAAPTSAQLGVRAGPEGGRYEVRVSSAGSDLQVFDLPLEPSAVWQTDLQLTSAQRQLPLVARLYEGDSDVESRSVVLQPLPASPGPAGASSTDGG